MAIRITETDDGRFQISADGGRSIVFSYTEAYRLKNLIQDQILRVPRTTREQVRAHWRGIKVNCYQQREEKGKRLFETHKLIDSDHKEIMFVPRRPKDARQIGISPAYYVKQLDDRDQARAREFWDQYI